MKLTLFLSMFTIIQLWATESYSQLTKLTLKLEDVKISDALKEIESQSEFFFLYSPKLIDVERKVNIDAENESIKDILSNIFDEKVKFAVYDRQVILTSVEQSSVLSTIQQQKRISGTVTDENRSPLPGVNVQVEGTTIGSITDINGKYSIDKPNENVVLVFSFIGYINQKVSATEKTTIDISLFPSTTSLDEVVVVGYGTVLKKNITTSISKVTVDEVPKAASSIMSQLLLGRASGVQATLASSQPGGNVNLSIRGAGTPIYVVDGVVMPGSSLEPGAANSVTMFPSNVNRGGLAGLDPDNIESVEILKDASASIYGIAASNGVILITTKKGKEGPLKVNYNGSYSVVSNYNYLKPLDAQQYMNLANTFSKEQYLYNNKLTPYGNTAYTNGWTPSFDAATIASAQTTDWVNMVLRNGAISKHEIALNGGNKSLSYYISGNYFLQTGTVSNSSMKRYAIRSNLAFQLTSFIKLTSIINANRNDYNNSAIGENNVVGSQGAGALIDALRTPSYIPLFDSDGKYSVFQNIPNPVALEKLIDLTGSNGLYINFAADFTIIKEMLTAKILFGDNSESSRRSTYIPSDVYFDQMYKSRGNLGSSGRENQTLEATMAFNKKFGSFMNFDAIIGVGKYVNKSNGMNIGYNDQNDAIKNDNLATIAGSILPGSYISEDEKRSQFTRINFDILDRYVINSTLRRDGTDKFFPSKKYAFFPSVSAAWKISNESFMKGIAWINLLKLRASYGTTGSDNLGSSLYGSFGPSAHYIEFNQNTTKYIPIIAYGLDYPYVTWQKTTMKNIGMDFSLFKDRISGSFDVFQNDITNMLGNANTAGLSMFSSYPINGAHQRRQGWDANINTKNIQNPNFSWTSFLTLSRYNSLWITRFPNYTYQLYEKKGVAPTDAFYFYETKGIINADKSNMPSSQPAIAQQPGYPIIVDQDGNDTINIKDVKMINNVPKIYFGFGNTFTYKNFDLNIFIYSMLGIRNWNYALSYYDPTVLAADGPNQNTYSLRMWNSQTNPNGTLPGIAYNLTSLRLPGGAGTDLNYQNASFIRVQNLTLGYNFTSKMLGGVSKYISRIRLYVDAQNPFTFTKFEGVDPEVDYNWPQTRTFTAGINVTF